MPSTHTADFQTAALKATDLEAVEKINVGLETELARKQLNIIADAPEIRIQDKTGSASETTMSIVADGGTTHFRAGVDTFAEGTETKGNVKFQSSTGATTHAEIVGSSGTLELQDGGLGLKMGSNVSVTGTSKVIQEITGPHARESAVLKRYPEMKMGGLDNQTKAGVTVSSSSTAFNTTGFYNSNVYNQIINNEGWHSTAQPSSVSGSAYTIGGVTGEWHKTEFPNKLKVQSFHIAARYNFETRQAPEDLTILGSNDDSTWVSLKSVTGLTYTAYKYTPVQIDATEYYKYLAVVVTDTVDGTSTCTIGEMYWMAREYVGAGDDSVDTTVKSVYNAPDLTSAALYIDGKKSGSTPTDYGGSSITVTDNGTWDSSDNTWSLSGATTSNLVSADLGFVGDQPHSISAWVKADVLNGDGLFHVGTAEGEGDAASRVGFVDDSHISWGGEDHYFSNAEWHNVAYTYNGEGSDKKLYLDGRHVGTAKNEDTFGEYPPFDMSGYSEYGYAASATNDYTSDSNSIRRAWNAYEEGGQPWMTEFDAFSRNSPYGAVTSGAQQGVAITDTNGTSHFGHYNKLETPFKLQVGYLAVNASVDTRRPGNVAILGSNDDENWDLLYTNTSVADTQYNDFIVNSTRGYKYHMFMVKNLDPGGEGALYIVRLQYYGHRENDLVRFPDSVNVLKYPHVDVGVPRDNPAKRGYVVTTGTSIFSGRTGARAFDDQPIGDGWETNNNSYNLSSSGVAVSGDSFVDQGSGGSTYTGHWIKLQLPRKIRASAIEIKAFSNSASTSDDRRPDAGAFLGSNDNTNWYLLHEFTSGSLSWSLRSDSTTTYETSVNSLSASNTNAYKYIVMVITNKTYGGSVTTSKTSIRHLRYYGTEPEDVVARVGDGFDGKVRNLRVFSTALSDARVQEIFDADKDEFGLAKSSVSVHRGHLGVGTTEAKAALTVMDEVAELEEFPPSAMAADETYIEGHGVFRARASSRVDAALIFPGSTWTQEIYPWQAFNKTSTYGWVTTSSVYTNGLADSDSVTRFGILGEWLEIEMPSKIKLNHFTLSLGYDEVNPSGTNTSRFPKVFNLHKSNDGVTWTTATEITTPTAPKEGVYGTTYTYNINESEYYNRYLIQVKQTHSNTSGYTSNSSHTAIGEWRLFGTREQGASTLHNGELSLTRNLTVPRIGPPLDADDTPRRDRLVVEYNTSTNPTENGLVKDTSGRGLDGAMKGSTSYSSAMKALDIAGIPNGSSAPTTSAYIDVGHRLPFKGNQQHTISFWYNKQISNQSQGLINLWKEGTNYGTTGHHSGVLQEASGKLSFWHWGADMNFTDPLGDDSTGWRHVVAVYTGTTVADQELYINGIRATFHSYASGSGTASIDITNAKMTMGQDYYRGNYYFQSNTEFSGIKVYDVALTADEVKRLYDMGRCDEGHHVMNFSKTRVGIGLGDGEVSDALLNVGGIPYGPGVRPVFFATNNSTSSENITAAGIFTNDLPDAHINVGGCYDGTTGRFTAKIAGTYMFTFHAQVSTDKNSRNFCQTTFYLNGTNVNRATTARGLGYLIHQAVSHNDGEGIPVHINRALYLNVGDYVQVGIVQITDADVTTGRNYTWFTGYLLS
jgi:hypothetical protein